MMARLMGLRTISPDELNRMVEERRVTVVDVNSRERWAEAHVPGALNLDPARLCRKAPIAARRAEQLGHRDVKVMSAGIQGWLAARLPTEGERGRAPKP